MNLDALIALLSFQITIIALVAVVYHKDAVVHRTISLLANLSERFTSLPKKRK